MSLKPVLVHKHSEELEKVTSTDGLEVYNSYIRKSALAKNSTNTSSNRARKSQHSNDIKKSHTTNILKHSSPIRERNQPAARPNYSIYVAKTPTDPSNYSKHKENYVPSYLRDTASSKLKAEQSVPHNRNSKVSKSSLQHTKDRSFSSHYHSNDRSKSELSTNSPTLKKPSSKAALQKLNRRDDQGKVRSLDPTKNRSKISRSVYRASDNDKDPLYNRAMKSRSLYYKELPKTPSPASKQSSSETPLSATKDVGGDNWNEVSNSPSNINFMTSYSNQDMEITEALRKEIPASFIDINEDAIDATKTPPQQKHLNYTESSSYTPDLVSNKLVASSKSKFKSDALRSKNRRIQSVPKDSMRDIIENPPRSSKVRENNASKHSPKNLTPQKQYKPSSTLNLSPSKLRAPSVSLKKSNNALGAPEPEKILSLQHTASTISLNKDLGVNRDPLPKSISMTAYSKTRDTSNPFSLKETRSSIPTMVPSTRSRVRKEQVRKYRKTNESQTAMEDDVSFLKNCSFDSEMTHMFDNMNINSFRIENSIDEMDSDMEIVDETSLEIPDTESFLKTLADAQRSTTNTGNTTYSGESPLTVVPKDEIDPISKSFELSASADNGTMRNYTTGQSSEGNSKHHAYYHNKSIFDNKIFKHDNNSIRNVRAPDANSSMVQSPNNKITGKNNISGGSLKKSVTMSNVSGKSLMKAVKVKHSIQKSDAKTRNPISTFRSINKSEGGSKKEGKISNAGKLYKALLEFEETGELVKGWSDQSAPTINKPMRASDIIQQNNQFRALNVYEKGELSRKSSVYFLKLADNARINVQISNFKRNFGFDDEHQNYIAIVGDHIDYRYEILQVLGNGSFGNVLKCKDHKTNRIVAIKIIKNDMQWSLQAVYEIKVLKNLIKAGSLHSNGSTLKERELKLINDYSSQNHVLTYMNHFNFRSHMCIVTELLSVNLYQTIQASGFNGFSVNMVLKWGFQLFQALKYIHSQNIIHCDLKPENIMLVSPDKLDIKVIDYGSACYINETSYSYIQSRFYRAPEVMIGARYATAIDVWSAGCILSEIFTGTPLFSGKDESEQLALNVEVLGPPKRQTIMKLREELKRKGPIDKVDETTQPYTLIDLAFDKNGVLKPASMIPNGKKRYTPSSKPLDKMIPAKERLEKQLVAFIQQCLNWDPFERVSSEQLLQHPFLQYYVSHQDAIEDALYS